jgi:ornithine carbamoyltransferase
MDTAPTPSALVAPGSPPLDTDSLLTSARELERAAEGSPMPAFLRGKNLGLICESADSEEACLFRSASTGLGARMSHIRLSDSQLDSMDDETLRHTARFLGRLYDGIECQGLDPLLVSRLQFDAGVPVLDGLASSLHATAPLAQRLQGAGSPESKRLLIAQAALLVALLHRNPCARARPA